MNIRSFVANSVRMTVSWLALAVWLSSAKAFAVDPQVAFDLAYTIECRDVGDPKFAKLHPDEKLMEADLQVSVRIEKGGEKDLDQLSFEITSPDKRLRVVDFLPRTQVQNSPSESVEVVKTTENTQTLGANAGVGLSLGGGSNSHVTLNAQPGSASATHRNATTETTKRLPPGKVVVASGTIDNEHGVFFKMRSSTTTAFEGIKPLSFRFVVPKEWRGDWMVFSAEARGHVIRHLFIKSIDKCGQAKAFLALYQHGDADAKRAATAIAMAQETCFVGENYAQRRCAMIAELATAPEARHTCPKHPRSLISTFKVCKICFQGHVATDAGANRTDPRGSDLHAGDPRVDLKHALSQLARFSEGDSSEENAGVE